MGLDISHSKPIAKNENSLDYFTLRELQLNPVFINNHKHLISKVEGEDVIFLVDKGYQRKQMNENFIKDFGNGIPYFDVESAMKAMTYLEAKEKKNQEELINNFKRDFIDNFVVGESIFWACW